MDHKRDYGQKLPTYITLRAGDNSLVEHLPTQRIIEAGKLKADQAERIASFLQTAHELLGPRIGIMLANEVEAQARLSNG